MSELKQESKPTEEAMKLLNSYLDAEKALIKYLETLDRYGTECSCEEYEVIEIAIADEGATPYCLICGGVSLDQEWV